MAMTLSALHERLDAHFRALAETRQRLPNSPGVYAIEHGLAQGDLSVLGDAIESWISQARPSQEHRLPFVVYTTEVGYRYEGDEYWPTLERRAPGWERRVGRAYVRSIFRWFKRTYFGAKPQGRWAEHRSIISWPITHAILPTDLQRQLARLLYECRGALTNELLDHAAHLGGFLGAHAHRASKRFQQFAQNTELLGNVAMALLADGANAPTIDPLALERIKRDLNEVRQARQWLSDAKSSADRIRIKGASRGPSTTRRFVGSTDGGTPPTSPVDFWLHLVNAGWQLRLRVPDFAPLFGRRRELRQDVAQARCRVVGTGGKRRATGWLLDSGQQVALAEWPGGDEPVFELDRVAPQTATLFAEEARTPPTERWLFRRIFGDKGLLVRSGLVRPGARYLLLGPGLEAPLVDWIREEPVDCVGAVVLAMDIPQDLGSDVSEMIRALGCDAQSSVTVTPLGVVPAAWDGAGYGEWLLGDQPILGLSSDHEIIAFTATLDESEQVHVQWEKTADGLVALELSDLGPGWHDLRLSFLVSEGTRPIPDLRVGIRVREAEAERTDGTFRQPLRLRVHPQGASLEDFWDGRSTVEADGPYGLNTTVMVALSSADEPAAAQCAFQVPLPLTAAQWPVVLDAQVTQQLEFQNAYDDATHVRLDLGDDELGHVSVVLERELEPLRWGFRRSRGRTIVRLYQSADTGGSVEVSRYPFRTPYERKPATAEDSLGFDFFDAEGGLFVAQLDGYEARAILPPTERDLRRLRRVRGDVRVGVRGRSAAILTQLVGLANLWSESRCPGDWLAHDRRNAVCSAVKSAIASTVGGHTWSRLEHRYANRNSLSIADLEAGLAKPPDWQSFRAEVVQLASGANPSLEPPVERLGAVLGRSLPTGRLSELAHRLGVGGDVVGSRVVRSDGARLLLAEVLLRLASEPGSLCSRSTSEQGLNFNVVLERPVLFRGARMLAIVAEQRGQAWEWD